MTRPTIPAHITIKQLGSVFVMGKASTLTRQLKQLADHAMIGGAQDIDPLLADYNPRISFEVMT